MDEQLYAELSGYVTRKDKTGLLQQLEQLDETTRAEFARRQRMERDMNKPYDNKPRCADGQLGKFCLLEYDNVEREFETLTAFVAMSNYLYDRLLTLAEVNTTTLTSTDVSVTDQQDDHSRDLNHDYKAIKGFLDGVFNHRYSKHVDTIYDIFLKPLTSERNKMMQETRDSQLNPAFIPAAEVKKFHTFLSLAIEASTGSLHGKIVECSFMDSDDDIGDHRSNTAYGEYCTRVAKVDRDEFDSYYSQDQAFIVNGEKLVPIPSFWQYRNALNFYNTKLEEHRFLASQLTGMKPSSELLLHVHGVFANTEDMETYRIKKSENIRGKAVVCPIGRTALGDEFRTNKDGIVMYNPADPEIEIMMQGKHNIRRVEAEAVKKRMSRIADRTDPETVSRIRKWRQEREKLVKGKPKVLSKLAHSEPVEIAEVESKLENAISSIDRKIHEALEMLDDDEVIFETLEVKDGKLKRGEDLVMKID